MTFGETLRELRTQARMTQAGLAAASGLSLGVIRDYEQTDKLPSLPSAFKLADALGVEIGVFRKCLAEHATGRAAEKQTPAPLAPADPSDDVAADRLGLKGAVREAFVQGRREMRAEMAGDDDKSKPKKATRKRKGV
jgi:transcriptional regulator with XRE-family HTH domain